MARKPKIQNEKIMDELLINFEEKSVEPIEEKPIESIDETISEPIKEEPKPIYKVKIMHPSLRRRNAPALSGQEVGLITDKGVYEIFDEINGWGKLENGDWIMLSYTQVI
jgi:hypothetical protein